MGISAAVTVAGVIKARLHGDTDTVEIDVTAGTLVLGGNFAVLFDTGTTATLANDRVTAYIFDPSTVKY